MSFRLLSNFIQYLIQVLKTKDSLLCEFSSNLLVMSPHCPHWGLFFQILLINWGEKWIWTANKILNVWLTCYHNRHHPIILFLFVKCVQVSRGPDSVEPHSESHVGHRLDKNPGIPETKTERCYSSGPNQCDEGSACPRAAPHNQRQ